MLSLVNEKCIPAALPELCVPRQELMKKLSFAASDRFIYMGAPAGSGKTVSALLWNSFCRKESSIQEYRKSLWISLDVYDNVPSVFYKLLSAVLCSTQPDNKNMHDLLSDSAFSSSPVEYTIRIISEMQHDESFYNLTLDDLHLINNPEILNSLPSILKRLPQPFMVLFLSRNEPPQPLKELFRNEKTAFIGPELLRFSPKELKVYFNYLGRSLTDEETGTILLATNGLAIGINAISKIAVNSQIASGNQENSGHTEYVFANYIRDHLWDKWDINLQEFMLKTSIVDEITEKLAITLTGRTDAGKMLQELCSANTFVSHVGKDMFRYHHLFLSFLRDMVKEKGLNLSYLYKAAAKYYLDAKQYLVARNYAVLSGNDNMILQVIYQFNQYSNPALDEYDAISKIFNRSILEKGICERHPYLYTSLMEAAWISGDSKAAEHYWDKLLQYLPIIALKYPKMLETVIMELAMDHRKTILELLEIIPKLPAIIHPNKTFQVSTATLKLPFVHRCVRDLSDLANENIMEKLNKVFFPFLYDMGNTLRLCIMSSILLEKNRIEEALVFAMQGKEEINIKNPEIVFCAYNHLSAVYFVMGNEALLNETLAETERFIIKSGARFLDRNFLALKTIIRLFNAEKKAAEEWLSNYFINDEERIPLYKIFQYFATVRACIVLNKGLRALFLLEKIIQFATEYRRPLDLAEARTLKACLEWVLGHRTEAASILEEVLLDLQNNRFIRIIADEGAAVVPILKRISIYISAENYKGGLDRAYVTDVILAAHKTSTQYKGITAYFNRSNKPVKLSNQQKKVMELLAKGYRNQEIAKITGLALPTVKGHLMLAYEKLDVNNAMDALLKAKSLGLISDIK